MKKLFKRKNKKKDKKMIWQLIPVFILGLVLLSLVTMGSLIISTNISLANQFRKEFDRVGNYQINQFEQYKNLDWMVDYWLKNKDKMDIVYDDYDEWTLKCLDFLEKYAKYAKDPQFAYMQIDNINNIVNIDPNSLSEEDQKLFAEIMYEKVVLDFDDIDNEGIVTSYQTMLVKWQDKDTFTSIANGIDSNESRNDKKEEYEYGEGLLLGQTKKLEGNYYYRQYDIEENGKKIASICVVTELSTFFKNTMKVAFDIGKVTCIFFLFVVAIFGFNLRRHIVRPLEKIAKGISQFSNDRDADKLNENMMAIREVNEIGRLAEETGALGTELISYINEVQAMTAKEERMSLELDMARGIQNSVLLQSFSDFPKHWNIDLFAIMRPAKEVGGDLYDFIVLDQDHIAILVGDVSGKSIPAALFMMRCLIQIKSEIYNTMDPKETLRAVNNKICVGNDSCMFITVWLGIYEISTGTMLYANAGHDNSILLHKGEKAEFVHEDHGLALGVMEDMEYTDGIVQLNPGDSIFLYTDGLPEGINRKEEAYGMQRILDTIDGAKCSNAEDYINSILESADQFADGAEQFDDITLLCLKVENED